MQFTTLNQSVAIPERDDYAWKLANALWDFGVDRVDGIQSGNYYVTGDNEVVSLDSLIFLPDERVILAEEIYFAIEGFWTVSGIYDFFTGDRYAKQEETV